MGNAPFSERVQIGLLKVQTLKLHTDLQLVRAVWLVLFLTYLNIRINILCIYIQYGIISLILKIKINTKYISSNARVAVVQKAFNARL